MPRSVALGVDSSTQSTKVVAVDLESGETVAEGRASHSGQDTQDPAEWWHALAVLRHCRRFWPSAQPLATDARHVRGKIRGEAARLFPVQIVPAFGIDLEPGAGNGRQQGVLLRA